MCSNAFVSFQSLHICSFMNPKELRKYAGPEHEAIQDEADSDDER